MAGGGEDVLVTVQVHVQEQHVPRPVGGLDSRIGRDLLEGPVAAVPEQRVALPLGAIVDPRGEFGQGRVRGDLRLAARPPAQHVHNQDIDVAVAVHVGEVDRHGGVAGTADGETGHGMESPGPVVQPKQIGILEVIADVEVRRAIAVHVGELGRHPEVFGRRRERLAGLVEEPPLGPGHQREVTLPVVQVEAVRVGSLLHRDQVVLGPVHHPVILPELGHDLEAPPHPPDDLVEGAFTRRIGVHRGAGLVVGNVEIEMPVSIHVGQRHRHAAGVGGEAALRRPLGEHTVAVVQERRYAPAKGAHQQVQVAIPVHIRKHGAGRVPARQRDAGPGGDVFEVKVA